MFGRSKNRGVTLTIGVNRLRATSTTEFDAALNPLTVISAQRMAELASLDDEALIYADQELERMIGQLSGSLNTDAEIAETAKRIQALGGAHTPWSEAFQLASGWQDHQRPFRQSLLNAYRQYLSNERVCLHTLQANRQRTPREAQQRAGKQPPSGRRQQLIFSPRVLGIDPRGGGEMALTRLGKGNVIEVPLQPGQSLTLMFSRHLFLVVCGDPWLLIDTHGEDTQLQPGRNLVGRSNDCDVVVNERYFAVSRRHALLETDDMAVLKITDLSSLGTFIPHAGLENRFH